MALSEPPAERSRVPENLRQRLAAPTPATSSAVRAVSDSDPERGKTRRNGEWHDGRPRLTERSPRPVDALAYCSLLRAELGGDLLMAAPFQFAQQDRATLARG